MTREDAINFLNTDDYESKGFQVALGMAIKALEQQDRIIQILDDYVGEAWEILEKIKEVVRE